MHQDKSNLHFKRTRIAPTPSGFLHMGNAFSFALTAALAKRTGASILLRIDDLDAPRIEENYVNNIFETLRFLEINWNEGPRDMEEYRNIFSQQHRIHLYDDALTDLRKSGKIYACSCSRSQLRETGKSGYPGTCRQKNLSLDEKDVCWRLDTSEERILSVKTLQKGTQQKALPAEMLDFIVRRRDGLPSYQLSSVVDDIHFKTDLIVRGEDLWASTLAQLYLSEYLPANGFSSATFFHHPLFTDHAGNKLSKSKGDTSIRHLREQGMTAGDVYALIEKMNGGKKISELLQAG